MPCSHTRAVFPAAHSVGLTWSDVLPRDERVQLNIVGKGGKVRQVLLPEVVSRSLLSLRGGAGASDPVFASRKGGGHLNERAVNGTLKRIAKAAGVTEALSPHWLRHAHGSHANTAPRCRRCRRRLLAAICTPGRTLRAACASTRECFFDEAHHGAPDK